MGQGGKGRAPGGRIRGVPRTSCCCPWLPLVHVSWGPLKLRIEEAKPMLRKGDMDVLKEEHVITFFVLRVLSISYT